MEKGSKRKRMRKKQFSSPTLKDERKVRQTMTKKRKEKRREKEFATSWLKYERVKTQGRKGRNGRLEKKKEKKERESEGEEIVLLNGEN